MAGFLLIVFCLAAAACVAATRPVGLRVALVIAMVLTGAWVVAGTELLGLGRALAFGPLLAWWAIPTCAMVLYAAAHREGLVGLLRPGTRDGGTRLLIIASASILIVTGIVAATTLTNTWDCWTYHLPRQVYWAQQCSVDHFPAHDRRQLEMSPGAEFIGLHFMILSGGDAWSNMVQWLSFLGAAIAASLAARELGAGARGQALAALLVVTNPAAVGEAMNGKNDVVEALWVLCLGALAARVWRERRCGPGMALLMGLATGLAVLTKGTGVIAAAPIGAALAIGLLGRDRLRAVPTGVMILLTAAALNIGHWSRNYKAFHHPIGIPMERGGYPLQNTAFTPAILASNLLRELALHAGGPGDGWNAGIRDTVVAAHRWLGIEPNDPRTTMLQNHPFEIEYTWNQDGNAAAPVHILLAFALLGVAAARPRMIRESPGWAAFLAPYAAFVLFAALLRWQPWALRHQIPIVSMLGPVAGCLLPRLGFAPLKTALVLAAFALASFNLVWGGARRLAGDDAVWREGRLGSLYHNYPPTRAAIEAAVAKGAEFHPRIVGVSMGVCEFEYPVLREVQRSIVPRPRLADLNPNFGPKPGKGEPTPDVVIGSVTDSGAPIQQYTSGKWYLPVAVYPPFSVYVRKDLMEAGGAADRPPFWGWTRSEGIEIAEGPYPQWELPVVRWAKAPRTKLTFVSDGKPAVLVMECRRNDRDDQALTVRLNGAPLHSFQFGTAFLFFEQRVPLAPRRGVNVLEIEYANTNAPGPPRSVLYRRLQILPADAAPPAPGFARPAGAPAPAK